MVVRDRKPGLRLALPALVLMAVLPGTAAAPVNPVVLSPLLQAVEAPPEINLVGAAVLMLFVLALVAYRRSVQ